MRYRPAMILMVSAVAVATASAALVATWLAGRAEMRRALETQAVVLASTAAQGVDAAQNTRAAQGQSFTSEDYATIERALRRMRDSWRAAGLNVRYVYTLVPDTRSPTGLAYAVDAEEEAVNKSQIGEPWITRTSDVGTFDYRHPQAFGYEDRYGEFFSGFMPVRAEGTDVAMVVGVDLDGSLVDQAGWRTIRTALGPVALIIVLAVLLAGIPGRRLVRPLENLRVVAQRFGQGDLTVRPDVRAPGEAGAIAVALQSSLAALRHTVRSADDTSQRVREACERLLATAEERRKAVRQATERTADAARRARAIVAASGNIAHDANAVAGVARESVEAGTQMQREIAAIEGSVRGVVERGHELARNLQVMRDRAATVDSALETIVQVANRSSVLSLNAEIEANQAGPAGRGFAVVAREIRRLAEQAAASSLQVERNLAAMHEAMQAGDRAAEVFDRAAQEASQKSSQLSMCLSQGMRELDSLTPRLQGIAERGDDFNREGRTMDAGLAEAEAAVAALGALLENFDTSLAELRDRSQQVHGLLAQLRTEE
ncbi:MAG: methyl-accepting chemotaxis protein [Phycisphaerales bacterium]